MNILQLCKAAERYELLCMMNLKEDEIRRAAERYEIQFDDLYFFISKPVRDIKNRGIIFAQYVGMKPYFVYTVLLNPDFYEIWDYAVNN